MTEVDIETLRDLVVKRSYAHRAYHGACKVCGNVPDADGTREHGRGCYTQSEDGGGSDYVELPTDALLAQLPALLDEVTRWREIRDHKREVLDEQKRQPVRCTFCDKSKEDCPILIDGPGVRICGECVELCSDVIGERGSGSSKEAVLEHLHGRLEALIVERRDALLQRDHHRKSLNEIADLLNVVHEDDKIVERVRAIHESWLDRGANIDMLQRKIEETKR